MKAKSRLWVGESKGVQEDEGESRKIGSMKNVKYENVIMKHYFVC